MRVLLVVGAGCCSCDVRTSPAGSTQVRMVCRIPPDAIQSGVPNPSAWGIPISVLKAFPCSSRVGAR